MKATFLSIIFSFSLYACTNEMDETVLSQNEKNIVAIKEIAAEYGYKSILIEYKAVRTTPLTDEEIQVYREYFENTKKWNNIPFKITQPVSTREAYYGKIDGFNVTVYWEGVGSINYNSIAAGVGGSINSTYWDNVFYVLDNYNKDIISINDGIITLLIRADYRTEHYMRLNGKFDNYPYYVLKQKAYVKGYVDTKSMQGSFNLEIIEAGSWFDPKTNF